MKNLTAQAVYNADIYLRLSDDDGDKPESNSIKNQREFITEFLKSMPEIRIHAERKDDGFSGVDFFRPGIQEVLQDVRSGAVNCVVVKDLSRLGRNYIETGKVLQEFADHGVRFIAINDGYDTANAQGQASTILLPIKNLMNDSYSRDISVKIRSHLEVKKRKGQFVGAFAAYGYLKSPDDKNQLVVDDYAAEVVRDIFRWKLEGMSQQGIADRLNADGVLSPSEYKRSLGMKYISGFKSNPQAKWSAVAVGRILKNPLYIGVMVQGKTGRPNYKIKKLMEKPEDEWIRVPGAHEPIISEVDFRTVSGLLRRDTRIAVQKKTVYPFSGLLFCADCKQNMLRVLFVGFRTFPAVLFLNGDLVQQTFFALLRFDFFFNDKLRFVDHKIGFPVLCFRVLFADHGFFVADDAQQIIAQLLFRHRRDLSALGNRNIAGFFRNDNRHGISDFTDPNRRAVTRAVP